ncbi:MAG TPA: hypothetical protein VGK24_18240 [Candidatus Angelobacter sp.]|jgi:hypothetical protein
MKNGVLALVFFFLVSVVAMAQCGDHVAIQQVTCCEGGLVRLPVCVGFGTGCETGTGGIISPCNSGGVCGYLLPGDCLDAKATNPNDAFAHPDEWFARADAKAFHDAIFGNEPKIKFVSCSTDKSEFNNWLEAKLRDQRKRI